MNRPALIFNESNFQIWHLLDRSFLQPKIGIRIVFYSSISWKSPENFYQTKILAALLNLELIQHFDEIQYSGGVLMVEGNIEGLEFYLETFSDKFEKLLANFVSAIMKTEINPELYEIAKGKAKTEVISTFDTPNNKGILKSLIKKVYFNGEKLQAAEANIQLDSFKNFRKEFFESLEITVLAHGNVLSNCSFNSIKAAFETFFISDQQIEKYPREVRSLQRKSFVFRKNTTRKYSVMQNYYQFTTRSVESLAKLSIILELLQVELFKAFKNEKKIAFRIDYMSEGLIDALLLTGISKVISPDEMNSKFESFLFKFETFLKNIKSYEFIVKKDEIISMLKEGDKSLKQKSSKIWNEIKWRTFEFDKKNLMIKSILNLGIDETYSFFKTKFTTQAGKMSVQIYSNSQSTDKPLLPAPSNYIGVDEVEIKPK